MLYIPHPTFRNATGAVDPDLVAECCERLAMGCRIPYGKLSLVDNGNQYGTVEAERTCQVYMRTVVDVIGKGCKVAHLHLCGITLGDAGLEHLIGALDQKRSCVRSLSITYDTLSSQSINAVCHAIAYNTWCVRTLDLSYNLIPLDMVELVRATISPLSHLTAMTIHMTTEPLDRILHILRTGQSSLRRIVWNFPGHVIPKQFDANVRQLLGRTNITDMSFNRMVPRAVKSALIRNRRRVLYHRIALRRCLYHR